MGKKNVAKVKAKAKANGNGDISGNGNGNRAVRARRAAPESVLSLRSVYHLAGIDGLSKTLAKYDLEIGAVDVALRRVFRAFAKSYGAEEVTAFTDEVWPRYARGARSSATRKVDKHGIVRIGVSEMAKPGDFVSFAVADGVCIVTPLRSAVMSTSSQA